MVGIGISFVSSLKLFSALKVFSDRDYGTTRGFANESEYTVVKVKQLTMFFLVLFDSVPD